MIGAWAGAGVAPNRMERDINIPEIVFAIDGIICSYIDGLLSRRTFIKL